MRRLGAESAKASFIFQPCLLFAGAGVDSRFLPRSSDNESMSTDADLLFRPSGTRDPEPGTRSAEPVRDSIWTLPLLCLGLSIIACCVLLPAADANRKLVVEREKLKRDLAAVDKQIEVNEMFLKKVSGDPELAERLAQRQMRFIREGTNVLELPELSTRGGEVMNPFLLTALPGAAPMKKPPPRPGILGKLSTNSKMQLYALGAALLLLAIALVMGSGSNPQKPKEEARAVIRMVTYGDGDAGEDD